MRSTLDEPILRAIARLAPFAALSFILQNAYNQLDAWFLGRVGPAAIDALGLFMMIQIATFGVVLILARGTQSLVGRRLGAGQGVGAALATAQGLGLAARLVLPFAALQWIFAPQILRFMGGSGEAVEQATLFLRTLYWFMPALFVQPLLDFVFQALGDTGTPFRMQLLALSVNALLNAVLVLPHEFTVMGSTYHFGGLGVMGSALATGLSRTLAACILFGKLVHRYHWLELLRRPSWRWDGPVVREILRVGLPAGTATLAYSIVGAFLLQVVGLFGQDAYGAYGVGFRGVESFSFMILLGIGTATATVVAHAVGAGDLARARRAGHVGTAVGVACMTVTGLLFLVAGRPLASIYTSDAAILEIAAGYIGVMAFCQVPQALETVYSDAMAGAGSTLRTVLISIPGNALRVPLARWFAVEMHGGLRGVWYAILVSALLKAAGVTALYLSGRWEAAALNGRRMVEAA
ncbi:MAG TPA: MATE family efflux transporter [Planctomycetota bacterium]|nr:MATE family efflux transporter [Planctomycetota bacterium]